MRDFLARTSFGLDAQVRVYRHRNASLEFMIVPMVHAASAEFYAAVENKLNECDLVLYEGIRSTKARVLIRSYEIAARSPKLNLVLQRNALSKARLSAKLVHADASTFSFEQEWSNIPLRSRLAMWFLCPVAGLAAYFVLSRECLARILVPTNLSEPNVASDEPWSSAVLGLRDRHLVGLVLNEYQQHRDEEIRIGVLFGASHARVVGDYLVSKLDFRTTAASTLSVFSY